MMTLLLAAGCSPSANAPSSGATPSSPERSAIATTATARPKSRRAAQQAEVHYSFGLDRALATLTAEVCFERFVPKRLMPPSERAIPYLRRAMHGQRRLELVGGALRLDGLRAGDCVAYTVDGRAALDASKGRDGALRVADDVLLSPDLWLWYPDPLDDETSLHARFDLPAKLRVAVPWRRTAGATFDYEIPRSAFAWQSQAAFGQFDESSLPRAGGAIRLSWLGDGFGSRRKAVNAWLTGAADAVIGSMGPLPTGRAQLLLVPTPGSRGSFGLAVRGGGASATLWLPARPTQAQLDADWTAVHELLHFYLPPMRVSEAWLYEGFVTYFTATARAAAGIVTENYAWWELLDGFERGRRAGTGATLREESRRMHATRAYWRVYWAGAAMALEIDVALRERGQSLVGAIARIDLDAEERWHGESFLAAIDRATASSVASQAGARHLGSRRFPEVDALLKRLGVALHQGETVSFNERAPAAKLRRAMLRASPH